MMHRRATILLLFLTITLGSAQGKIDGISFVATPRPFSDTALTAVQNVGATHISVIPYGFTRPGEPKVYYDMPGQWWGEKIEGARKTIKAAHEEGLEVMLKPQVYVPGSWIGAIDFEKESDWEKWEDEYTNFILNMAKMADEEGIAMLCIGTEIKISVVKRTAYWIDLIQKIRAVYCGQITYSANWDNYQEVPLWEHLDFIGISSYFPLNEEKTPLLKTLVQAWQPIKNEMVAFSRKLKKPFLFTEYGYLSVDGAAGKTWELEKKVNHLPINEKVQAIALDAMYSVFYNEPYWAGGFLWKWFPDMKGHEGYPRKDYTPQGKEALSIVQKWFKP